MSALPTQKKTLARQIVISFRASFRHWAETRSSLLTMRMMDGSIRPAGRSSRVRLAEIRHGREAAGSKELRPAVLISARMNSCDPQSHCAFSCHAESMFRDLPPQNSFVTFPSKAEILNLAYFGGTRARQACRQKAN